MNKKQEEGAAIRDRIRVLKAQHDHAVLRKMNKALEYKEKISAIRLCHEALLEAEVRLVEAQSDIGSLEERNVDILQRQQEERQRVREVEANAKVVKEKAQRALEVVKDISASEDAETVEHLQSLPHDLTMEALEHEIAAEESKLDFIQTNNPNAIAQFEKFQQTVNRLKSKVAEADEKLGALERTVGEVRAKWEPGLDKLVAEISDAFSYNFEQIGCAGEVSIHKDEDFEAWAIQIKVKFR